MENELQPILEKYKEAILFLSEKIEGLKDRVDNLEDLLCNQVIGGIKNLYDTSVRTDGVNAIKGKYSEKISPFEGVLPEFGIKDWSNELYDHLDKMRKDNPDFSDEDEGATVEQLLNKIQEKVSKIASATGAKPVAASVTLEKPEEEMIEEEPKEDDGQDELIEAVRKMKGQKNPKMNY